jgi:BarA-like signal transduction histidine kinase
MTKFRKAHKAIRMGEYIVILNAPKHQVLDNEKIFSGVVNCLLEVEPVYLRRLVKMNYKFDLKVVFDRLVD